MTREILFRGKRVNNGEWVEGYYSPVNIPITGNMGHFINVGGYRAVEIDPDTVGQFTGLTDKNGAKIFEGDILACHNNPKDIYKVVLGEFNVIDTETFEIVENVVGWHTEVIPTADPLSAVEPFNLPMPLNKFYLERSEMVVIGNIYDNPELLEVSESD